MEDTQAPHMNIEQLLDDKLSRLRNLKRASHAADMEQLRRLAEIEHVSHEAKIERQSNSKRASHAKDIEQLRQIAEVEQTIHEDKLERKENQKKAIQAMEEERQRRMRGVCERSGHAKPKPGQHRPLRDQTESCVSSSSSSSSRSSSLSSSRSSNSSSSSSSNASDGKIDKDANQGKARVPLAQMREPRFQEQQHQQRRFDEQDHQRQRGNRNECSPSSSRSCSRSSNSSDRSNDEMCILELMVEGIRRVSMRRGNTTGRQDVDQEQVNEATTEQRDLCLSEIASTEASAQVESEQETVEAMSASNISRRVSSFAAAAADVASTMRYWAGTIATPAASDIGHQAASAPIVAKGVMKKGATIPPASVGAMKGLGGVGAESE